MQSSASAELLNVPPASGRGSLQHPMRGIMFLTADRPKTDAPAAISLTNRSPRWMLCQHHDCDEGSHANFPVE